jgi:Anti-sigma-K factor rskA, C-terminal
MNQDDRSDDGTSNSEHPTMDDLATLAVGALPELEAARLNAHISGCAGCTRQLAEYAEVATALAEALPAASPRPALGASIMRAIEEQKITPSAQPEGGGVAPGAEVRERNTEGARRRNAWPVLSGLAAAAALGAIAVLGFATIDARQDADDARDRVQNLEDTLANGTLISMTGTDAAPDARVTLIVAEDRETALVTASGLPANEDGTYHLWLFDEGEPQRVSAFDIDDDETLRLALEGDVLASDSMAITLEDVEQADAPEGPVLVEGEVTPETT